MQPTITNTSRSKLALAGLILMVWSPDDTLFKRLMKEGVFPGKVDGDEVILDEFKPPHLKMIISGERGVLFSWDKPTVFVKVGK